jgi:riboflavin biosynthesis pyrimidine reductase
VTLRQTLAAESVPRDWVVANFVTNLAGETARDGTSRKISNEIDKASLLAYRDKTDVILTSASTAIAEKYQRPASKALAIASRSSNFASIPAVESASTPLFLITTKQNAKTLKGAFQFENVYLIGIRNYSPRGIRRALKIRGYRRTVLEAGVDFTDWFAGGRALNELALTIVDSGKSFSTEQAQPFFTKFRNVDFSLLKSRVETSTALTTWIPRLKK